MDARWGGSRSSVSGEDSRRRESLHEFTTRLVAVLWALVQETVVIGRVGIDPSHQGTPFVPIEFDFLPVQFVAQQYLDERALV